MSTTIPYAAKFFMLARERYNILLRRRAGEPWPWTKDTHLQTWRFTNIFREDDRTTSWFRQEVRQPLCDRYEYEADRTSDSARLIKIKIVESTMIFRWFNRIETGKRIQDLLLGEWNSREALLRLQDNDPVFTGAYIIIGVPGQSKLEGVLEAIDGARPYLPVMVPKWGATLEGAWDDLKTIPYIGGFTGHEIVQDLRYTPVLENATDVNTWGNLGPGAIRGISWLVYGHGEGFNNSVSQQKHMLALMAELLEMSRDPQYWPAEWPKWEMHQVEFLLCETAKYFRALNGFRQKRRYEHP